MSAENLDIVQMRKAWLAMGQSLGVQPSQGNDPENLNKRKRPLTVFGANIECSGPSHY